MTASMTPAERLERATCDVFWLPAESVRIDRPELTAFGTAGRGPHFNSALRVDAPPARLPALLDELDALWAEATGSRVLVADTRDVRPLEAALADAGYAPTQEHDVRAMAVDRFEPRPDPGLAIRRVTDRETFGHSIDVAEAAFGPVDRRQDVDLELARLAGPAAKVQAFVAYDGANGDDRPIATGNVNLYCDLDIAMLWGGSTIPAARGRGAYSALVAARIAAVAAAGIGLVALYARVESSSPIAAAQGFERHGSMRYWQRTS